MIRSSLKVIAVVGLLALMAWEWGFIEKHFSMDKACEQGTDHVLSATPAEFKDMINKIQRLGMLLGKDGKKPSDSEKKIKAFARNRFIAR